nr:enoyl-CoA hydratase/isomerase family protein [Millisia brevis]
MTDLVNVSTRDGIGHIELNRPKAINALNHEMVVAFAEALTAWSDDDSIRAVLVTGAGERGLCAGGDIVAIRNDALAVADRAAGEQTGSARFWWDEYLLNAQIGNYPKPYVAIMDGIVMGGGVGISGHGSVRVVTERTRLAMPEVGIGYIPDVGGTRLLSHAPGGLGIWAALTAIHLSGADAIAVGLADHFVESAKLPDFIDTLVSDGVEAALAAHAGPAPESALTDARRWIDPAFAADSPGEIIERLRAVEGDDAAAATKAADAIAAKSPIALSVTLSSLRQAAADPDLETSLVREFRVSISALTSHDLPEGIRAQVVDKDRSPSWKPATLAEVTADEVAAYFEPLERDLTGFAP